MYNETVVVQHSSDEQRGNSAPDQFDARETVKTTVKKKPTAMTPTPLEYSCWTRHPRAKFIVTAITFTGLSIVLGILIVFLTSPEADDPICSPMLNPTVQYSRRDSSHPMSIAVGDFNNDTYIDIVVANSGRDNVGVFLGYGNNSFANQVTYSTGPGSAPNMVIVTDFNHDNRLDIAVTNFGANNIGILLGREDGKFRNQTTIDTTPSRPRCLAFGDFNNDEQTDIVFSSYGTGKIYILLGFGNGNFTIMVALSTGYDSLPHSVAVGDLNEDNQLDIVVANHGTDNVGVFLGCENGTFTVQTTYTTALASRPYSIAIADLNKDMHLDIAVVNSRANNLGILFGDGNGGFFLPTFYSTGDNSNPISIVIADLNNDDKLDIATANNGTDSAGVFLNHGNGTFADQMAYSTGLGSGPYSIAIADFNNDSQIDLAIANEQNNNVMIFNGYSNEVFAKQINYSTNIKNISPMSTFIDSTGDGSTPYSVTTGDLNNDGRQDVVVANYGTNNVGIFLGNDNGTFASQTTYSTGDGSSPQSVSIGDFNNDGWRDIAVANSGINNVGVLLGNGDGTFANQTTYSTGYQSEPTGIIVDDFNNDGRVDIVVTNAWANNVGIFLGNGNGTFASQTTYSTGDVSSPRSVSIDDFNNDGWRDIAVANFGTNNVGVLLGNGDGTFTNQIAYPTGDGSSPTAVTVGDFNSDSRVDIAVANLWMNNVGILLGNGDGTFRNQTIFSTGVDSKPYSITVGDLNNDSRVDIVVANYGTDNVGILLGNGDGTFRNQTTYFTGYNSGPIAVTVADFNNDNRLDLIIANYNTDNVLVLCGNGNGTFPSLCTSGSISRPSSVAVGDFNNDSQLDIAVTDFAFNNVGIFLGYGDGNFASHTILPTGCNSNPTAIALGDFNNDSQLDIAVANFGAENVGVLLGKDDGNFALQITYSTGVRSQPYSVAVRDLNNDGRLDIAVTNPGTDTLGIFLGYGDGTFASRHDYFVDNRFSCTGIVIEDLNNDDRLDIAIANPKKCGIGIFFGYGDGTFQNQEFFSTGVFSSPLTLAVGSFNNDTNVDIAVVNRTPREEVISILCGNGNGNFSRSGRYKTGFSSNPSSIVVADFNNDNQPDIAVANNGTDNVGIFYGYGNGVFSSETTYPTGGGSNPTSVAIGDFNNDNHVDVVVANYGTSTIGIFLAFKNLSFVTTTTLSTGSAAYPRAVAFGDFNNDGQMDVVVANSGTENVGILHRYENGSFSMQIAYSANFPFYPESIVVNDFNNDNRLDIAVANPVANSIGVLFGGENGTLGNYTAYSTGVGFSPQSIALGDFNNDHGADVVVAYTGIGSIGLFLKADPGSFEFLKKRFSTGSLSKPEAVAVGDFDNDGRLDIAVANNGLASIGFFFASENGTFLSQSTIFLGYGIFPVWIGVGDFNNDKQLDVVVADNIDPAPVIVLLGNGNRSFQIEMTYDIVRASAGAIADFDNDGRLDLALCQYYASTLTILLGYGDGTFGNAMTYSTGQNSAPASITIGDFNNDSRLDIAVANQDTGNVGIFLRYDNGTFASQETYPTGDGADPCSLAVGDFNNDGRLDIAVANLGTNNVGTLLGYGDGTFENQKTYSTGDGSAPVWIAVGDFNNDGRLDIAVAHSQSGHVGIFLGYVNGTFFSEITYATSDQSEPVSIAVGDLNNDGRLDIIFCDLWKENIGVLLGYADENFIRTEAYPIGSSSEPVSIAVGDFDNNTHLDVVAADRNNNELIVLRGSGYGTFSSQTSLSTGKDSHPSFVAVSDFNQDHRLDIAVVNSDSNTVGIFLGYGNGTFSNQTTYSTGDFSLPVSLAVGTFDNDTQLDIAVANSGISSVCLLRGYGNGSFMNPLCFSSGFGAYPSAVAFGDMNNDSLGDVVVCNDGFSTIEILSNVCKCTSKFKNEECERKIKTSK